MNADQLLRETFVDHEHLAPDADETLRQVRSRLEGRSGATRLASRRRLVAVATGIGVAATIVGIVAASVIIKADDTGGPTQPATITVQPSPPSAASSYTRPVTVLTVEYLTIAAGYLPLGKMTQVYAVQGSLRELRSYLVTDGGTRTKINLSSAASVAALPRTTTFTGPGTALQVPGYTARQWSVKGRSRVIVTGPGRLTAVDVTRAAMPAAAIAALTRKIAGGLRYYQHDALQPAFRLGYVPTGLRIGQLSVDNHRATTWLLAAYGSAPSRADTQVYSTDTPPTLHGPAGRTVEGHPTRTGTKDGVPVLEIVGAIGQDTIVISGSPRAMSLSQLYKIGDGLALS